MTVELMAKKSQTRNVLRLGKSDEQNLGNKSKCVTCCDLCPGNYPHIPEKSEQLLTNCLVEIGKKL